ASTAPTWPRSRTTPPSVDHSRATPSRRSSSAPPPGPAPVAPRCYCPSGSAGRPRTASAPPNAPPSFPMPSGKASQDPRGPVPSPSASSSWRRPAAGSRRLPRTLCILLHRQAAVIEPVEQANPPQPFQGPSLQLPPNLTPPDEIPPHMGPAKGQHDHPVLDPGHRLVRRIAIDHQHPTRLGPEVVLD